ncbi:MAG TPA: hypothetical protein PK402_12085 [Tepidisphaeraceae bacterium]|nr:hypothetical protein [Tepidisphaeraceae bacterium]
MLSLSHVGQAALLASDSFNYTLGAGINGQSGGSGFLAGSNWAYSTSVTSTSSSTIIAGLTFSDLPVSGNAFQLRVVSSSSINFGDIVNVKRRPATVPNGTTDQFWTRCLFKMDTNITATTFYTGLLIDDAETVSGYRKFGMWGLTGAGNGVGGVDVDTSAVSATGATAQLSSTDTYLMISKFTNVNAASNVARVGKWWALSVADYNAIKADGITESELDAHHVQTATETVMPTVSQPLNMTTSDFFDFRGHRPAVSNAFTNYMYDEFYAATTLGSLGLPVPEPTTLTLESLTLCMIGTRARRRKNS